MRPLAVLIGIILGSSASIAIGLSMTWIVLQFLPQEAHRFTEEQEPLLRAIALFSATTAAAGASFYAELRLRPWRFAAMSTLLALLALAVWVYWPR